MKLFEGAGCTVLEAFEKHFYIVPEYQREYIWSETEVNQLLEDITNHYLSSANDAIYFIGTVLVCPPQRGITKKGIKRHFEVIDGQQRMITLFLLLCAIRAHFSSNDLGNELRSQLDPLIIEKSFNQQTHRSLRLNVKYENASKVLRCIAEFDGDPSQIRNRIDSRDVYGSSKRIIEAFECIYKFLGDKFDSDGKLEKFLLYILERLTFIQIATDVNSALKIFETINDRGVGLDAMDLVKNRIFANVAPEKFEELNNRWKDITSPLEQSNEKPLRFLKYFLMSNYDTKGSHGKHILHEKDLFDWFSKNEKDVGYNNNPTLFVDKLKHNVDNYVRFSKGHDRFGNQCKPLQSIKRLAGGAFRQHYILLLAISEVPPEFFDGFLRQLECYLFYIFFTKTQTNKIEQNFSEWADDLRSVSSTSNSIKLAKSMNEFVNQTFNKEMLEMNAELNDALLRLSMRSTQRAKVKYLLARLTEYVQSAFFGADTYGSEEYYKLHIEHILPENPLPDLLNQWKLNAADADNPDEFYFVPKDMLGNLVLLEKPLNIVAKNDFFEHKAKEYKKSSHYLTRSLVGLTTSGNDTSINRINRSLASYTEWNEANIRDRQEKLAVLAYEVWKISDIGAHS